MLCVLCLLTPRSTFCQGKPAQGLVCVFAWLVRLGIRSFRLGAEGTFQSDSLGAGRIYSPTAWLRGERRLGLGPWASRCYFSVVSESLPGVALTMPQPGSRILSISFWGMGQAAGE